MTPTPTALSVTPSPSPSTSSTLAMSTSTSTTSIPTPTNTAVHSTTSHLGAIVGGAVGGAVGIGLIALLWFFCLRTKQAPDTLQSEDLFRYNPVHVRRPSEAFIDAQRTENLSYNTTTMSNTNSFSPSTRLSPVRRPSGPVILQPPYLHRQGSAQSDLASSSSNFTSNPTSTGLNVPERPSNVDIRALAQEVAAVLYQGPPVPPRRKNSLEQQQPELSVQNHADLGSLHSTDQPPPNYRTAMGPSTYHT